MRFFLAKVWRLATMMQRQGQQQQECLFPSDKPEPNNRDIIMKKIRGIACALILAVLFIVCEGEFAFQTRHFDDFGAPLMAQPTETAGQRYGWRQPVETRGTESVISYVIFGVFGGLIVFLSYRGQKN
jgi:hypothetical protein